MKDENDNSKITFYFEGLIIDFPNTNEIINWETGKWITPKEDISNNIKPKSI